MESFEYSDLSGADETRMQGVERYTIRICGSHFVYTVSSTDLCQCMGLKCPII